MLWGAILEMVSLKCGFLKVQAEGGVTAPHFLERLMRGYLIYALHVG